MCAYLFYRFFENPTIDFSVHTFFPLKINLLNLIDINYYMFYLPLFFKKDFIYLFMRDTLRQGDTSRGKSRLLKGSQAGDFILGLQITREPKADTQSLTHPGVTLYVMSKHTLYVMSNLTELPYHVLLRKIVFLYYHKT